MGEDSFGLLINDDDAPEATKANAINNAAEAVNPGVIIKSTSASEVISRSNESLDDHGGVGGLRSSNRTSFKAARQHVKVQGDHFGCVKPPIDPIDIKTKVLF